MTAAEVTERYRIAAIGVRGLQDVIGGIETHCAQLYPALAEQAPELDIRVIARRRYTAGRRTIFHGVAVRSLWAPHRSGLETLLHTPLALFHARFRERARLVHLHAIGPGFFAPLARLLGMRVVVTHHAPDFLRPKWGWAGRLFLRCGERLTAHFADRVICVSDALAREFLRRYPGALRRTEVVRHGIAASPAMPSVTNPIIAKLGLTSGQYLIAVGRYDETKRFEELIVAHGRAGSAALPLVIVGAGDRAMTARLKAAATDSVHFAGFRSGEELNALYQHAAALFHPSAMEGFGLVILEALAAGLPVRVSDIPVHREFDLPEESYFAVDDTAALTDTLTAIGPRTAPCLDSLALAKQHSFSRTVEEHHRILRSVGGLTARPTGQVRRTAASGELTSR